jgi:AcrR family transcriptional regulator
MGATAIETTGDGRRQEILHVATRVFAEHGFQTTTMEQVAKEVGFTKPIIYQHFSGKDALYEEIVATTAARLLVSLQAATSAEQSPRQRVESAFRIYFELVVQESDAFRVLFLQAGSNEHSKQLRAVEVDLVSFIEPLLADDLDDDHRRELAGGVVGMAEGAAVVWLVRQARRGWPRPAPDEASVLAKRIATLAWGGLRATAQR